MKRLIVVGVALAVAVAGFAIIATAQGSGAVTGMSPEEMGMEGMMGGAMEPPMRGMMGEAAIAVSGSSIYVVVGGLLLKYDSDLNLVNQAELPVSEMAGERGRGSRGAGPRGGMRGGGRMGGGGMGMMGR